MSPFRTALVALVIAMFCAPSEAFKFRPTLDEEDEEPLDATSLLQINSKAAPAVAHQLKQMNSKKCKVMCQRFGMKALSSLNSKFKGIKDPNKCVGVCDEVFH
eukprot:TRINITY_DN866_c0_g1_i1.p1 TRINITY_DN866_c0_g1~~TRINITY_DN866_c0_g1_i1.p1  ORF type:complete len:103 (-),score=31.83 TRINITY_DN866_c0_g1_i1:297-605(-)